MFKIRRMGTNDEHDGRFEINRPNGYDCFLFLFVKTKAEFTINGANIKTEPNTYIIFNPGVPHFYCAYGDIYINDWIQFETNTAISDVLTDRPVCIGRSVSISLYTQLISEAFYRENCQGYTDLMKSMLSELAFISENSVLSGTHSRELAKLRRRIYEHPETPWTIKLAAEAIHISEPHFQELYRKSFGISFGADLIKSRIESAQEFLRYSDLSVSEIGFKCGYNSSVHFSRQFSQNIGMPPSEWRKQFGK